jgi:hypothetical protein
MYLHVYFVSGAQSRSKSSASRMRRQLHLAADLTIGAARDFGGESFKGSMRVCHLKNSPV